MGNAELLMGLGVLFLIGLVADQAGRFTRLPRVTMLLLLGLAAGQAGLNLIPGDLIAWFEVLSIVALTMVAFLLGGTLTREILARRGRAILILSLVIALGTAGVVVAGLVLIGLDWQLALVLGAIATVLAGARHDAELHLAFSDGRRRAWLFAQDVVQSEAQDDDGFVIQVRWTDKQARQYAAL